MTLLIRLFSISILAAQSATTSFSAETETARSDKPAVTKNEFESFQIVLERNIFNPNRQKRVERRPVVQEAPPPQIDRFTLLGSMIDEASAYAFFVGSSSQFNSVLHVGDAIAQYKIVGIQSDGVTLECDGQQLSLQVGKGMQREDEGEWKVSTDSSYARGSNRSRSRSSREPERSLASKSKETQSASADSSDSSDTSDLLKKMMEKRRQELEK